MSTIYTCGTWRANAGSEDAFVAAWKQFAAWASNRSGAGRLQLARDLHKPEQFVSFGDWASINEVRGWKSSPEFLDRMAQVLQHVAEFQPAELTLIASATDGTTTEEEEKA